jgi:hypothetical protein
MSLEGWKSFFEIGGVALLFLTFIFGAGLVLTTNRINRKQAGELRDFQLKMEGEQQKTASAQKEAAEAQLALKQYVGVVAKSVNPRTLDAQRFLELLKGKPKGTAEIWYEPDDRESQAFAIQIHDWLGSAGAGWKVVQPKPLSRPPHLFREAASGGLAIITSDLSPSKTGSESAYRALSDALELGAGGWGISGHGWSLEDHALPANHFVIIVGHHRTNVPLVEFARPKH